MFLSDLQGCFKYYNVSNQTVLFCFHKGGVACVRDISNPISLARKVMEETPHCLLCGEGAMNFAKKMDVPLLDSMELITNDSVCKSFVISDG